MKKAIFIQTLLSLLFLMLACGFLLSSERVEQGGDSDFNEDYVYHLRHGQRGPRGP